MIVYFLGSELRHCSNKIVRRFCKQGIVPSSEAWKMRQEQDPANVIYVLHQLKCVDAVYLTCALHTCS